MQQQLEVILVSDTNQLNNISVDLSVDHNFMVIIVLITGNLITIQSQQLTSPSYSLASFKSSFSLIYIDKDFNIGPAILSLNPATDAGREKMVKRPQHCCQQKCHYILSLAPCSMQQQVGLILVSDTYQLNKQSVTLSVTQNIMVMAV
jgi:hypothetical protein